MSNETRKLSRRNFLKTSAAGAAAISLAANAKGETFDPLLEAPQSQSSRVIIPLNHDWLYSEKPPANATAPLFNDKNFIRVTIPHTNKMLPCNGFDEKEYMFVSVYRRHFQTAEGTVKAAASSSISAA